LKYVSIQYKDSFLIDKLPIDIPDDWDDFLSVIKKEKNENSIKVA